MQKHVTAAADDVRGRGRWPFAAVAEDAEGKVYLGSGGCRRGEAGKARRQGTRMRDGIPASAK